MIYLQFEDKLLVAIVRAVDAKSAADPNSLGQGWRKSHDCYLCKLFHNRRTVLLPFC
jgi:hypothetical protein